MTLPGQALRVDLRPAFRKPLADVTPKFRALSIGYTFIETVSPDSLFLWSFRRSRGFATS